MIFIFTNEVSEQIWKDRYQKNNETLTEQIKRVADACSNNVDESLSFYDIMNNQYFFPAGRTISNAGLNKNLTLNNCYTFNFVEDTIPDIFEAVKQGAITSKMGGGIGFEFSKLRPRGTNTSNDAVASGVVSFMNVFNAGTGTILQGNRRGANMGILSIYHPDIFDFLESKSYDEEKLAHFNLSIMVDDNFMNAKNNNLSITLHFPVYDEKGFMLTDESKWTHKIEYDANKLWDLIMHKAYSTGEYGVFFYDNLNKDNNTWYVENIIGTNPCSEFVSGIVYTPNNNLNYKGACNLGSLFLHNFVKNPFMDDAKLDYDTLKDTIWKSIRMLDNIIDLNNYPNEDYKDYQTNLRTIGLGITGLADMLVMLNLEYGTYTSIWFVDELMDFIARESYKASIDLAKEKGSFPLLNKEKFVQSGYVKKHLDAYNDYNSWTNIKDDILKYGIRNARLLSIAPTGTMSLVFGNNCSSGLEPIFMKEYDRKIKIGGQDESNIQIHKLRDYAYDLWLNNYKNIVKTKVTEDMFVTINDLDVEYHLNILEVVAFHTDMACAKTVNCPTEYTFEQVKDVYDFCWNAGIKGCTIFRPNEIRQGILINTDKKEEIKKEVETELPWGTTLALSEDLIGRKRKIISGCGSMHVNAYFDKITGRLLEVFLSKGSTGGCMSFEVALSRVLSAGLRTGLGLEYALDQLKSTPTCASYAVRKAMKNDTSKGNCCPSGIANALRHMQDEINKELGITGDNKITMPTIEFGIIEHESRLTNEQSKYLEKNGEIAFAKKYRLCPQCIEELNNLEGCLTCSSCGFTKCG